MEAKLFTQMLGDKHFCNIKKMQFKYSVAATDEMLSILKENMFSELPLLDFNGRNLVYLENKFQIEQIGTDIIKQLMTVNSADTPFGMQAMEEEIYSTLSIESIQSTRESVRKIICGAPPQDESEQRILSMKKGLEFISNPQNTITEENIHTLYMLTINSYLESDSKLLGSNLYRHDEVYIVSDKVEHMGIATHNLSEYMQNFVAFINAPIPMNDLLKACAIHFYFAYLHPYFDGNGRMARLMHIWYLVSQGYPAAMFIPFSKYINATKTAYYNSYTQIEENSKISHILDITPFLSYFTEHVYNKIN